MARRGVVVHRRDGSRRLTHWRDHRAMAAVDHVRRFDRTGWKEGVGHFDGCVWIRERAVEVGVRVVVAVLDGGLISRLR